MSAHDECRGFLTVSRAAARADGKPTDKGAAVFRNHADYYTVQDVAGKTVYEGRACCAYAARHKMIMVAYRSVQS
jgi:hypothetical protein